jgi:hypothetical protein
MRLAQAILVASAAIAAVGWSGAAIAQAAATPGEPMCAIPETERAPDPRCGEALDGRTTAPPPLTVTRAALAVPRLATKAFFWPVVQASDVVERYQLIDWMDAILTTDDGLVGVRPIVHYSTSFLPSGGARFFYDRLPGPGSEIAGQFQTAGPQVMLAELDLRGPQRSGLFFAATWNRRDDRLFAGIGPQSAADLEAAGQGSARYASDNWAATLRWSRQLPMPLTAYGHGDFQRRDYSTAEVHGGPPVTDVYGLAPAGCAALGLPSSCVDPQEMPGFSRGLRLVHAGGGLGVGLRAPGRERPGATLILDANFAQGVAGDPSRHATFSADGVLAVGKANRSFVLRGRAAMVQRLGDAPIPFDELVSPAGDAGMRGFPDGRFRGESGLIGTAEYRWYIASYLDATLFSDVGTVAGPGFSGLDWGRWFPTFGVGFRLFKTQGAYWDAVARDEVQFAYAPDSGFRMILAMTAF